MNKIFEYNKQSLIQLGEEVFAYNKMKDLGIYNNFIDYLKQTNSFSQDELIYFNNPFSIELSNTIEEVKKQVEPFAFSQEFLDNLFEFIKIFKDNNVSFTIYNKKIELNNLSFFEKSHLDYLSRKLIGEKKKSIGDKIQTKVNEWGEKKQKYKYKEYKSFKGDSNTYINKQNVTPIWNIPYKKISKIIKNDYLTFIDNLYYKVEKYTKLYVETMLSSCTFNKYIPLIGYIIQKNDDNSYSCFCDKSIKGLVSINESIKTLKTRIKKRPYEYQIQKYITKAIKNNLLIEEQKTLLDFIDLNYDFLEQEYIKYCANVYSYDFYETGIQKESLVKLKIKEETKNTKKKTLYGLHFFSIINDVLLNERTSRYRVSFKSPRDIILNQIAVPSSILERPFFYQALCYNLLK